LRFACDQMQKSASGKHHGQPLWAFPVLQTFYRPYWRNTRRAAGLARQVNIRCPQSQQSTESLTSLNGRTFEKSTRPAPIAVQSKTDSTTLYIPMTLANVRFRENSGHRPDITNCPL